MTFIIVFILFFVILTKFDPFLRGQNIKYSLLMALVADGLLWGIITNQVEYSESSSAVIEKTEIVALQDGNETSGKFFLSFGRLNDEMHYAYYYETDFGITYDSISAENKYKPVYIRYLENDSDTPYILQYGVVENTYFKKPNVPLWLSIFASLQYNKYEEGEILDTSTDTIANIIRDDINDYRYEIWIPEGSILEEYELDLK